MQPKKQPVHHRIRWADHQVVLVSIHLFNEFDFICLNFSKYLQTFSFIIATPMMSPAPTQDSMGYSVGFDHQQAYDGSMGYDPSLHQDLSP